MRCLGIFTSILLEVATTNLFCVQPRETKLKTRGPITSNIFFSCFKKSNPKCAPISAVKQHYSPSGPRAVTDYRLSLVHSKVGSDTESKHLTLKEIWWSNFVSDEHFIEMFEILFCIFLIFLAIYFYCILQIYQSKTDLEKMVLHHSSRKTTL